MTKYIIFVPTPKGKFFSVYVHNPQLSRAELLWSARFGILVSIYLLNLFLRNEARNKKVGIFPLFLKPMKVQRVHKWSERNSHLENVLTKNG